MKWQYKKKGKRKVQGVPQSQTAALPRPQEEENTTSSKTERINKARKVFCVIEVLRPSQPNRDMSSAVILSNHTFNGQAQSSKRLTSIVQILLSGTDNCPSWISGRERMTVENISLSISTKKCRPRRGLNPRRPGLQLDGASKWATKADPDKSSMIWSDNTKHLHQKQNE